MQTTSDQMNDGSVFRRSVMGLMLIIVAVGLAACEEDVVSVLGTERIYSIYGSLDPRADTQFVRVYPIESTLEVRDEKRLDAEFVSRNLDTGEEIIWTDSLVQEESGLFEHVYWAAFTPEHDETYQLVITRADGERAHATVKVPPPTTIHIDEPTHRRPIVLPVRLTGDAPNLIQVEVTYHVQFDEPQQPDSRGRLTIPYSTRAERTDAGWSIEIEMQEDYGIIRTALADADLFNIEYGIGLIDMELNLMVVNKEWDPPGGVFDPDILVQPGTMSNVENGFGFIGAGYANTVNWLPDRETISIAGFRVM